MGARRLVFCMVVLIGGRTVTASQGPQAPARGKPAPAAKKPAPKVLDPTGADVVTLRDGSNLIGQVSDGSTRAGLIVYVRRSWAEAHLPEWAAKWKKAEAIERAPAEAQRRARLESWRRDRQGGGPGPDRINAWLDRELAKPPGDDTASTLMPVRISRSDVKQVDRRGMAAARALRLGWTIGLKDAETLPLADLNDALAGRGLLADGDSPIPLDALLATPLEGDAQWLRRRAATEVSNDEGLRFVRFGNTVLPEPGGGGVNVAGAADAVLSDTIKEMLGFAAGDPMLPKLRVVASRGRVGAMVTRLDLAPDMESVTVRSSLYVMGPGGYWSEAVFRSGTIRSSDVGPGAVDVIADDPQVKSLFGMVDSLGFGGITPEMKRKGLAVGAMTRRALSLARSALSADLTALALPVDAPGPVAKAPDARP